MPQHRDEPTLVVIPTYNELESLPVTLGRLRAAEPDVHVLVVDDASPDGTGELADRLAADDDHVHVLHRTGKNGLGTAYLAGFAWGLERDYAVLCEMDADGSHQPEQLGLLLDAVARPGVDLAVGSRWVPGGEVVNWPRSRKILSVGGNTYTRVVLGLPLKDSTAGFRAYTADVLRRIDRDDVASQGYCFQVDMTWHTLQVGGQMVEVPITFVEREAGESKMSQSIVVEALWRVTVWGAQRRWAQVRGVVRPSRRNESVPVR